MDAKAEVVWLYEVDAGTDCACWFVGNRVDEGAVPFIPLTDHEAALADLRNERDELFALCEKRGDGLIAQSQGWEAANERIATLLTGLEALAGVVDVIRLNSDYADAYMVNENIPVEARLRRARQVDQAIEKIEKLRTLASAGLEGK